MSMPKVELPIHAQPSMRSVDRATLFRICSWADEGEIERAGEKAGRMLQDGVYDYQLVVLWLAYRFASEGMATLGEILNSATRQLLQDLDSVAPSDREVESRTLDRAFAWLASNVAQRIHFHSKVRDDVWSRWLEMVDPETMDAVSSQIEGTIAELTAGLGHLDVAVGPDELRKLDRRVHGAFGGVIEEVTKRRAETVPTARSEEAEQACEDLPSTAPPTAPPMAERFEGPAGQRAPSESRSSTLVGSDRLRTLQRKLEGFEMLARRGALRHAAIVARDVERELAQFDPLLYLPELFEGYLSALLEVGAELEEHMGDAEVLDQRALERLYYADPLRFLERATREGAA